MPADIGIRVYKVEKSGKKREIYEAVCPAMKLIARGETALAAFSSVREQVLSLLKRWEHDLKESVPQDLETFEGIPNEIEEIDYEPLKWSIPDDSKPERKKYCKRKRVE